MDYLAGNVQLVIAIFDNFSSTKFFKISIAFIANLLDSYKG